jgi:pimeloyl-ACP methyl ester carboxylesterase
MGQPLKKTSAMGNQLITRRRWRRFILRFAVVYGLVCTALYFQQQRLMFFPNQNLEHQPSLYQLKYQDIAIPVVNRDKVEQLNGWWIPEDVQIPVAMGQRLQAAARGVKQLIIVQGGGHDNHLSGPDRQQVKQFMDRATGLTGKPPRV